MQGAPEAPADQRSPSPATPAFWRIDTDHFQYGGILRKVERAGVGENADAGKEEEKQEEAFKEEQHVVGDFIRLLQF